jgi:hypothetical protein
MKILIGNSISIASLKNNSNYLRNKTNYLDLTNLEATLQLQFILRPYLFTPQLHQATLERRLK